MSNAYLTPDQTRSALDGYIPTRLDPTLWDRIGDSVLDAVGKAEPTSGEHAKKLVEALTGFLADQDDSGDALASVLTEQRVNLWLHANRARYTQGSLQQIASRLRRLARAVAGLPPRSQNRGRTAKKAALEPLSSSDLARLTGGHPDAWMAANARHPEFKRVRLTCDVRLLNEHGLIHAVRAGVGRRRLEAAAPHVIRPSDARSLLRGN